MAKAFKFSKTNVNLTAALLPAVSDPGRVFFNTKDSYYIKFCKQEYGTDQDLPRAAAEDGALGAFAS